VYTGDYKFSRDADERNYTFYGKTIKHAPGHTYPTEAISRDARQINAQNITKNITLSSRVIRRRLITRSSIYMILEINRTKYSPKE